MLLTALYSLEYRDDVGAVAVTGTGPSFSSSFGLSEVPLEPDGSHGIHAHFRIKALYYHAVIHMLARIGKPTLAAVAGPAAGGGLGMVLACDLAVCTDSATFLPAWMSIGIANDAGTSFYLSRIVGYRRAMESLLTNRTLGAAEALEWGVVNRVYPEAEFGERVREIAAQLAGARHISGFTALHAATWIAPRDRTPDLRRLLDELTAEEHADIFIGHTAQARRVAEAISESWELSQLASRYEGFSAAMPPAEAHAAPAATETRSSSGRTSCTPFASFRF